MDQSISLNLHWMVSSRELWVVAFTRTSQFVQWLNWFMTYAFWMRRAPNTSPVRGASGLAGGWNQHWHAPPPGDQDNLVANWGMLSGRN